MTAIEKNAKSSRFLRRCVEVAWPFGALQKTNDPHRAIEDLERASAAATLWILAGIIVEIVALFFFEHSRAEVFVGVLANGAIGLGLLVEYLVIGKVIDATKEAERASNERIAGIEERAAEANARASEAQLALEKYKARRHLTQDQWLRIVARISEYGPQQFDMAVNNADPEAQRIATSIFHHLWTLAKWHPIHWVQPGVMVVQWEPPGGPIPNWGINTMTFGVVVQIIPSERGQFVGVASALVNALFDEGIAATVDVIGSHSTNKDTIHILVGRKP